MKRHLIAGMSACVLAASVISMAPGAQALGNNRTVSRGCGKNYVASNRWSDEGGWAQTTKVSGHCKGRLSAALQWSTGYRTPRVYGDNQSAYTSTDLGTVVLGLHWGCDNCDLTTS
ncbi:hypothetical protein ABZT03_25530 [Streptomyces sp. NPDC005574]|uniref:hypothetical protein n=1 Tax=Streptomyces sp. NPDC005574 TaxID=3156891 RepID=UPI0033B8506E